MVGVDSYDDLSKAELRSHRIQVVSQSLFGEIAGKELRHQYALIDFRRDGFQISPHLLQRQ